MTSPFNSKALTCRQFIPESFQTVTSFRIWQVSTSLSHFLSFSLTPFVGPECTVYLPIDVLDKSVFKTVWMPCYSIVGPEAVTSKNEASLFQLFKARFLGWKEEFSKWTLTSYSPNTFFKKSLWPALWVSMFFLHSKEGLCKCCSKCFQTSRQKLPPWSEGQSAKSQLLQLLFLDRRSCAMESFLPTFFLPSLLSFLPPSFPLPSLMLSDGQNWMLNWMLCVVAVLAVWKCASFNNNR